MWIWSLEAAIWQYLGVKKLRDLHQMVELSGPRGNRGESLVVSTGLRGIAIAI